MDMEQPWSGDLLTAICSFGDSAKTTGDSEEYIYIMHTCKGAHPSYLALITISASNSTTKPTLGPSTAAAAVRLANIHSPSRLAIG